MTAYGAKEISLPDPSFYVRKDGGVENAKGVDVYSGSAQGAIEHAQAQCPAGGVVKLDGGDFPITKQMRCWRSTIGTEGKTRLLPAASLTQTMIALATSSPSASNQLQGIVFGDMIIDGLVSKYPVSVDKSNIYSRKNFYGGVQLRHAKNCILRNLIIKDIPASHGIQLQASSFNTVLGCSIDTVGSPNVWGAYGNGICSGEMYAGYSAAYNLLEDCSVRNCSMVQVNWEPGDHNLARRVAMYGTKAGTFTDLDNKKKYCRAITIWQKGGFPASSGNIFEDCTYEGLGLAVSVNGDETVLDGCTIVTTGLNGENYAQVLFNGAKGGHRSTVRGCTFRPYKGQTPIKLADINGIEISGNDLTSAGGGVGISGTATKSTIIGNRCVGFSSPVSVVGTGNTIDGNGPSVVFEKSRPPASSFPPEASEPSTPVPGGGLNDASILGNMIKGGAVRWHNKAFGATGQVNEGSETELVPPDGSEWTYACIYMSNLKERGYEDLRVGFHDWQTTQAAMRAGAAVVSEKLLLLLDAARIYGIGVTAVIGGLSDKSTAERGFGLFDSSSPSYASFVTYSAAIADALHGTDIVLLELVNEADFITCVEKYWKSRTSKEFIAWAAQLMADVKAAQKRPGVPLGMGTAVDSSLYAIDWLSEISGSSMIIDSILAPCDKASVHTYIGDRGSEARKVWLEQKLPAFVAACKRLSRELIIGETGLLYSGGVYDAGMDAALQKSGAVYLWMVRRHDPKAYTIPAIPERPAHIVDTPAPDESSEPTSSDVIEQPPAQETPPETPEEGAETTVPETEGAGPAAEPPGVEEEPIGVPDEPAAPEPEVSEPAVTEPAADVPDDPPVTEPVTEGPEVPAVETPTTPSSPTPGTGRNVLVELAKRIAEILGRLFGKKK